MRWPGGQSPDTIRSLMSARMRWCSEAGAGCVHRAQLPASSGHDGAKGVADRVARMMAAARDQLSAARPDAIDAGRRRRRSRRRGWRRRCARQASDGAASSETRSAACPRRCRPAAAPSACAPPRSASSNSARARSSRLALPSTLRSRCARRCEYSSWRNSSADADQHVGIASRCRSGRRRARKRRRVEDAVAEIGLGDRAQAGDRAACGQGRRSRRRSCGWRGSGTSGGRPAHWSSSHSTGRAPRPGEAVLDLAHLLGDVDVDRAVAGQRGHRAQARPASPRAGCAARRRPPRRRGRRPRAGCVEQPREALEIVDEAPLARRRAARRRSRAWA